MYFLNPALVLDRMTFTHFFFIRKSLPKRILNFSNELGIVSKVKVKISEVNKIHTNINDDTPASSLVQIW